MISNDSGFTDLTRAQVEALMECFDFLRNGYSPIIDFYVDGQWIIKLRHRMNQRMLIVTIKPNSYRIESKGKRLKECMFQESTKRYQLMVNSDMSVGVVRLSQNECQKLVSG